MVVMLAYAELP